MICCDMKKADSQPPISVTGHWRNLSYGLNGINELSLAASGITIINVCIYIYIYLPLKVSESRHLKMLLRSRLEIY